MMPVLGALAATTLALSPVTYSIPGGMRVIEVETRAHTAAAVLTLETGLRDDKETPWVTHVTLAALLAGPSGGTPFHDLAYASGADLEVDVGAVNTHIVLSGTPAVLKTLLPELLQRLFARPSRPASPRDLTRWRTQAIRLAGAGAQADDASLVEVVTNTAVADRRLAYTPELDPQDLDSVELQHVTDRMAKLVVPANASLAVAGNVGRLGVRKLAGRHRFGKPRLSIRTTMESPREYETAHFMELHIYAYTLALQNAHQMHVAHVARGILQDRVTRALRAQGLAYSPQVMVVQHAWLDLLLMVLPIRPDAQGTVSTLLDTELAKLVTGGILEEEVERHAAGVRARFALMEEQPRAMALHAANIAHLPDVREALLPPSAPIGVKDVQRLLEANVGRDRRVAIRFSREALLHYMQMRSQGGGGNNRRRRR